MPPSSPWLVVRPGPIRDARLYCFAYAGGHAGVFSSWQKAMEPRIEICGIQLPGRGSRLREPPLTNMAELVKLISHAIIAADDGRPFAFFGHSFGALLAFEVARYSQRIGASLPSHLVISGCEAPTHRTRLSGICDMDDAALIEKVSKLDGTPPEVLSNLEIMTLLLPALRADFTLASEYEYQPGSILTMPMTILAGNQDQCGQWHLVGRWADETCRESQLYWFNGGHFFIISQRSEVLKCLRSRLAHLSLC